MLITINTFEFGSTHPLVGDTKCVSYKYNNYISTKYEIIVNTEMMTVIYPVEATVYSCLDAAMQEGEHKLMYYYKVYMMNKDTPHVFYIEKPEYERIKKLCYVDNKNQDAL